MYHMGGPMLLFGGPQALTVGTTTQHSLKECVRVRGGGSEGQGAPTSLPRRLPQLGQSRQSWGKGPCEIIVIDHEDPAQHTKGMEARGPWWGRMIQHQL